MSSPHSSSEPSPKPGNAYSLPATRYSLLLQAYFRSGWAFLIPYLAAYLLYAWLRWPVNPASGGEGIAKGISEDVGASASLLPAPFSLLHLPCLLHVYWVLHAIHLILGALALRFWWRRTREVHGAKSEEEVTGDRLPPALRSSASSEVGSTVYRLLPWICLALLFYIPGVYLEWPSDPWEHLRRISEWHVLDTVTAHSTWLKSSYFIPYSLLSWATGLRQIFWLDFYYTAVCLLLSWQYYRLAHAVGLGARVSFIFTLINAFTFGNNVFSFYRYYGISSSIITQIGAVAAVRIAIEYFTSTATGKDARGGLVSPAQPHFSVMFPPASAACGIGLLIIFSHNQGLGIAGLGVLAVLIWRLATVYPWALLWLGIATLLGNTLFVWLYSRPPIVETYRSVGMLNIWYGFNLFDLRSPAGNRFLQIVGFFGMTNLAAAIFLPRCNPVKWLTIVPFGVLLLPVVSIPFATVLAAHSSDSIATFQRMLFAIPAGLAIISLGTWIGDPRQSRYRWLYAATSVSAGLLSFAGSSHEADFRFWNSLTKPPHDLEFRNLTSDAIESLFTDHHENRVIGTMAGVGIATAWTSSVGVMQFRASGVPHARVLTPAYELLSASLASHVSGSEFRQHKTKPAGLSVVHVPSLVLASLNPADCRDWLLLAGSQPQFVDPGPGLPDGAVQNAPGTTSEVFSRSLLPINPAGSYQLESWLRATEANAGISYLAVAWYDHNMSLLRCDLPAPQGAGTPEGWSNGTYSYFGVRGSTAASEWRPYRIRFGVGETAAIPPGAAFLRPGAILNYDQAHTVVQLGRNFLRQNSLFVITAPPTSSYTPVSWAGFISQHWSPQHVANSHTGANEFRKLLNNH